MAKQKDTTYFTATEIAIILNYLLGVGISASNVYIALLQINLVRKDILTNEWVPTVEGKKFADERTYNDKTTGEEKIFFVWHREVVKNLKEYFEQLKIGGNK